LCGDLSSAANLTRQFLRCDDGCMTITALVPTAIPRPLTRTGACEVETTKALGEQIAALAMHLHAATYALLVLLREFDQRTGWHGVFVSCAHWLHWRTGIDLGAAREKVRAARHAAATPITWSTGSTVARRASTTWCCSAGATTAPSTRAWSTCGCSGTVRSPSSAPTGLCYRRCPTRQPHSCD
jgi:hypothetical protein